MAKRFLIIFIILACVIVAFFIFAMNDIKSSLAYEVSKEYAQENVRLRDELGQIEKFGWLVTGELITKSDGTGSAKFRYPVYGENDHKAMLNFSLSRSSGEWTVDTLYFDR